ncbi:MAG TPA: hypothetical protein VFA20_07085 [Myxococcaceae bacterium]|nr:hypothetical protein [Myxococcaceae bacterium]
MDAFVGGPAQGGDQLSQALNALMGLVNQLMQMLGGGGGGAAPAQGAPAQGAPAQGAAAQGGATAAAGGATASAFASAGGATASAYASAGGATASASPAASTTSPTPASGPGVFVVGDLQRFGGRTVRQGLEDMLRPTKGLKDRGGERTHSAISPQQAAQVQALLDSQDPNVQATLNTNVPDHKSLVISQDGRILETLDSKDVVANQSLNVGAHAQHLNDGAGRNYDRSAGGQLTSAQGAYNVIGTEMHSPIKIALDGKDAKLDSTHGFALDADGFGQGKGAVKTSGGLNPNEAWLMRDRAGDGLTKNGVVDGNDVYGDHDGKFSDGYAQLARDYKGELKTDPATGHRYIDLTDPNSRAAKELKLMDASGKSVPASSVLNRIDVDAVGANERDATGSNQIRQRASVTYKDGHTAQSADQWYAQGPAAK